MRLKFTKMHGLGNDFVVIDAVRQRVVLGTVQVRRLADRRFGIGCDQVLLVEPPQGGEADFRYRIFNADGSEVQQCGNGARCFARFVHEEGLTTKSVIPVETAAGLIRLHLEPGGEVRVDMGAPRFEPAALPLAVPSEQERYSARLGDRDVTFGAVSLGNPHAVLQVADVDSAPVGSLGPVLEAHPLFPERANIGFMQLIDRGRIRLRVYERGAGETLACGTGACAAVAIGRRWGLLDRSVMVDLPGGRLRIDWDGPGHTLWMTGPATRVFDGEISL